MARYPARRWFLKQTASLLSVGALDVGRDSLIWQAPGQARHLPRLPGFDGELSFADTELQMAADDWGRFVHRLPLAVLRPASAADISRLVIYANEHQLKVAMRGQGHCTYGQAQVDGGIVIDSRRLNAVRWRGTNQLDAEAGALWSGVAAAALERRLTPPVMPDTLMLSVGGTLSAGGTGATSCSSGAQVDHVVELDVVTGRGDLVTCSRARNRELFEMMLAGLGQCGIIVRARLRLTRAPAHVVTRSLTYADSDALLDDLARVATAEVVPALGGEITADAGGGWRPALLAGTFTDRPDDEPAKPAWMEGLRFKAASTTAQRFGDYLDRRAASVVAAKAKRTPNPSLALVLPEAAVRSFVERVLGDPQISGGIWRIELLPMIAARFKQPLHRLPEGRMPFTVRLQRRASAENAPDHTFMLAANQMLVDACLERGGRIYPPFAPPLSREYWERHYGSQTWQRLAAAKRRFDPNNVLTPGAGVFA